MMYKHHLAGGIFMSASKSKSKSCVVTGTIIAIALTALMCGVYAMLVKNGKLTDAYSEIIISASIALAVFIGALLSNSRQGRRGVSGLAVGIIYAFVVVSVPLLAYPTEVDWLKIVRIIAIAAVSGTIGGSINLVKSNKSFHKNRKKKI